MNLYPGDVYNFVLPVFGPAGANPNVTLVPVVTVIGLSAPGAPVVTAQAMTLVAGTKKTYFYAWQVPAGAAGDYIAIITYAADGVTYTDRYLDRVRVGDSRILGTLALDSTVAKDATVAKDSSVAHAADLAAISPANAPIILAIKAKVDTLPTNPASEDTLTVIADKVDAIHDCELGDLTMDKTNGTLLINRVGGGTRAQFTVTEDNTQERRIRTS